MVKERIVSDFDGVWTDPQQEAVDYSAAFAEKFSQRIGIPLVELSGFMQSASEAINKSPGTFGWEYKGMIIAPATADPYVFNDTVAKETLKELGYHKDTDKLIDGLFQACYNLSKPVFREGAREYLEALHNLSNLTIVTNSDTKKVEKKLFELFGTEDHGFRVIGNAKKYVVNNRGNWNIERTTWLSGLPRPVFLRRSEYNQVLSRQGKIDKVLGDIYELDLALPEAKGIYTILVATPTTPPWEVNHYQGHPNGSAVYNLADLTEAAVGK